jgi:hypothetical protein
MRSFLPSTYLLLLPPALALGLFGTRTAHHIHHMKGSRMDRLTMLAVAWSPLLAWLAALLISLTEGKP